MLLEKNAIGKVEIAGAFFADLVNSIAAESFGVVGTSSNFLRNFRSLVKNSDNGIVVKKEEDKLYIDLHIEIKYGVNIAETVKSLTEKIKYVIKDCAGFETENINVYIDRMSV